ncbi:MAG TPA: RNA polymerase factor sigma-54, partial [Fibrobacteraceae bacterium]|nr:RNA polymerase factor sigma-54 [Fibrobacteraceae bacterium]
DLSKGGEEPREPDEDGASPEDRELDIAPELAPSESTPDEAAWEQPAQEDRDFGARDGEDLSKSTDTETWERIQTYTKTLEDHLLEQLQDRKLLPKVEALVRYMIDLLDEDGYLRPLPKDSDAPILHEDPAALEIERMLRGELPLEETHLSVREALHVLQSFDPPGIGARNLRECLLLQAWRREDLSPQAVEILDKHFDLFTSLEYNDIGKKMNLSPEQVKHIILDEIARLHLKPGVLAGGGASPAKIPDLIVTENDHGDLELRLNDGTVPRVRISKAYRNLLHDSHTSSKDKRYIREKIKAADLLIHSIGQRRATMLRVMDSILKHQLAFFRQGPGHLKPMILQDVAEEIGMHISTVNRVTNGKYVQTDWGVMELKEFFSVGVDQGDGVEVSASVAKEAIKRLLAEEPKEKPYSDDQLVKLLGERDGLKLARRTVTKYRESMGFLPSRIRKKL